MPVDPPPPPPPPPPPTKKKGTQPPPMLGGVTAPPPMPGALGAEAEPKVLRLAGTSVDERQQWLAEHLIKLKSGSGSQEKLAQLREQFEALFLLPPAYTDPIYQEIDATLLSRWKKNESTGLDDALKYIRKQVTKIQEKIAFERDLQGLRDIVENNQNGDTDSYLIGFNKKYLPKSNRLKKEYAVALANYRQAKSEELPALFQVLQAIVKEMEEAAKACPNKQSSVKGKEEALALANLPFIRRQNEARTEKARLEKSIQDYQDLMRETGSNEFEGHVAELRQQLDACIAALNGVRTDEETAAVIKASAELADIRVDFAKNRAAVAYLFGVPDSWPPIEQAEKARVKAQQKAEKPDDEANDNARLPEKERFKGLFSDGPLKLGIDIQFLQKPQIVNIARFFAANAEEFKDFLSTKRDDPGIEKLIIRLNGLLNVADPPLTFAYIMDVAFNVKKRTPKKFMSNAKNPYENVETTSAVRPDVAVLIQRMHRFRPQGSALANKEDMDAVYKDARTYQNDRGIRITADGKYLYKRYIDLSYFLIERVGSTELPARISDEDMRRLARFLAKAPDEFLKEGIPDREAIKVRLEKLFTNTALTFEDIIDIAKGYLIRTETAWAPADDQEFLSHQVQFVGEAPDRQAAVEQKKLLFAQKAKEEDKIKQQQELERKAQEEKVRLEQQAERAALKNQIDAKVAELRQIWFAISPSLSQFSDEERAEIFPIWLKGQMKDAQLPEALVRLVIAELTTTQKSASTSEAQVSPAASPREAVSADSSSRSSTSTAADSSTTATQVSPTESPREVVSEDSSSSSSISTTADSNATFTQASPAESPREAVSADASSSSSSSSTPDPEPVKPAQAQSSVSAVRPAPVKITENVDDLGLSVERVRADTQKYMAEIQALKLKSTKTTLSSQEQSRLDTLRLKLAIPEFLANPFTSQLEETLLRTTANRMFYFKAFRALGKALEPKDPELHADMKAFQILVAQLSMNTEMAANLFKQLQTKKKTELEVYQHFISAIPPGAATIQKQAFPNPEQLTFLLELNAKHNPTRSGDKLEILLGYLWSLRTKNSEYTDGHSQKYRFLTHLMQTIYDMSAYTGQVTAGRRKLDPYNKCQQKYEAYSHDLKTCDLKDSDWVNFPGPE